MSTRHKANKGGFMFNYSTLRTRFFLFFLCSIVTAYFTGLYAEDITSPPAGYESVYYRDFETQDKAADYLGNEVWYFYDGGSASSNDNPELDKRFIISDDPSGDDNKALKMIKFDQDEDAFNSSLNPRTELSLRPSMERSTSEEVFFRIRTYFEPQQAEIFSAEFIQFWLHGSSDIPLQIEVRDSHFAVRWPGILRERISVNSAIADNVGRWITWEVEAKFNNRDGYWKVYKDGELVYEHSGSISEWPGDGGTWHPQYGAYANNGGDGTMEVFFDDVMIAEYTGILPSISLDILSPENNEEIPVGNDVDIEVSSESSEGSIDSLLIYVDDSLAATAYSPSHAYTLEEPDIGEHTIMAEAYDDQGNSASAEVSIEIYDPDALPEEFTPVDDAYTEGGSNMNDSYLKVEPDNRITYIKFNVDSLSGSEVTSAELTLSCSGDPGDGIIRVYSASDNNWTEEDITGSNSPSTSTELSSLDKSFNTGSNYTWDVTDAVSGTGEYSFILKMDSGGNDAWFSSKEGSASPVLEVTTSGSTPVTLEKSGKSRMRLISLSGMNSTGGAEARLILGSRESISAALYTIKGELIERVDMGTRESGEHRVVFTDRSVTSGMYFLRVKAGGRSVGRSFMMLK